MTYCIICEKVTNDTIQKEPATGISNILRYVIISCEHCGHFKHQYLEEIGNV